MLTVPVDDLALHLSVVHTSWAERKSDFLLQIPCQYTALRVQPTHLHTTESTRGRLVSGLWCSRGAEARHLTEVQSKRRVCMGHHSDTRIVT